MLEVVVVEWDKIEAELARSWFETSSRPPRSVEACQCDPKTIIVHYKKSFDD